MELFDLPRRDVSNATNSFEHNFITGAGSAPDVGEYLLLDLWKQYNLHLNFMLRKSPSPVSR